MRPRDPREERFIAWTIAACALLGGAVTLLAQARVPLATEADRVFAQIAIARDGNTVTIRGVAADSLQICVEPASGHFGVIRCFTAGQVRRDEVRAQ